ncbi:MAG: hypothetical protein NT023_06565 [Armatimonadetes bacterium]|nr:hypothetical protein [Armatimonadota bacterium]
MDGDTDIPPVFGWTLPLSSGAMSFGMRTPSATLLYPMAGRPASSLFITRIPFGISSPITIIHPTLRTSPA